MMMTISTGWDVAHLSIHGAFAELGYAGSCADVEPFDPDTIDPSRSFHLGNDLDLKHAEARRHLVRAVALFQAGMEALISFWIARHSGLTTDGGFVAKWDRACGAYGVDGLEEYATFYRDVRNAIVHPDTPERIRTVHGLRFSQVHAGMLSGWQAFGRLSAALGSPQDDNSWETMCEAHRVSAHCDEARYPDLLVLRGRLHRRHLDHWNQGSV